MFDEKKRARDDGLRPVQALGDLFVKACAANVCEVCRSEMEESQIHILGVSLSSID